MFSTSKFLCLLILIACSTLLLLNSLFMSSLWYEGESSSTLQFSSRKSEFRVEEDSGEDNGGRKTGTRLLTRIRFLLRINSLSRKSAKHGIVIYYSPVPAPAPAPAIRAETPAPFPAFKANSRPPPLHHRHHIAPMQSLEYARGNRTKERRRVVVIALSAAAAGATFIVVGAAILLLCKRSPRTRTKKRSEGSMLLRASSASAANSKASVDHGSDQLYLNSLAKYLENGLRLYQSPQVKNVDESKCNSDTMSCLDEENVPAEEILPSSDNESFHSVSSRPLNHAARSSSEENFSHRSDNCSPISSYRTGSPDHNVKLCTAPSSSQRSFVIPQNVSGPTHSFLFSSRSFRGRKVHFRNVESISLQTNELASKIDLIPKPLSLSLALCAPANDTVCSSPIPLSLASNGHIPKPPPPPPPPPPRPIKQSSFLQTCSSSRSPPPLPPPLPCQNRLITHGGKDGMKLPKLKPLHWDKVRAVPDRCMVWDKIRSSSFEFDEEMIESLFGCTLQTSSKIEEGKTKTPSSTKLVMEHKRLQNVTILMKALNASAEQVCNALTIGEGLTAQQLEALVKMAPTKEEEEKLSSFNGNVDELDPAEKFLKEVLSISSAFARSEVILYRETFDDDVAHLRNSFATIEEACKELTSSRLFFKLLEAVLKTGNRMNVGTVRGGARAFKLDALLKLADVKGADGKTTLLHFVVQEIIRLKRLNWTEIEAGKTTCEDKDEGCRAMSLKLIAGLSSELCNVKKTATTDLDVLVATVSNLSTGLCQLKQLVEEDVTINESSNRFVHSMKSFMSDAERIIEELKNAEKRVLLQVRNITEYYHGNLSKDEVNSLGIFVIVRDFLCMLDRVCKEVGNSKSHQGPFQSLPFDRRSSVSSSSS